MPPQAHAMLSASSAARWLACTPSAKINAEHPNGTTVFAEEGTLAHELGEVELKHTFRILGDTGYEMERWKLTSDPLYSDEMERCKDQYVEYVSSIYYGQTDLPVPPNIFIEVRVDFSRYVPGGFGTADCLIIAGDTLHVIDYKHGKGVVVDVNDNPQLKLYALGAYEMFKSFFNIKNVVLHICQPRAGGCHEWQTTVAELLDWAEAVVQPAARLAAKGEGEFHAGPHCRFCAIRATCRARADQARQIAQMPGFKKDPAELQPEEIGKALKLGQDVADWLEKLKTYAASEIQEGRNIPGYKLVAGRTSRAWDNQAKAFDDLRAQGMDDALLYERTPLTVAKLEKMLGKKKFAEMAGEHVITNPGKPTLVPDSDPRAPWSRAASDFANI